MAITLLLCSQQQQALATAPPAPSSVGGMSLGAPLVPYIVGGQKSSIEQFPWQVYIEAGPFKENGKTFTTSCGGSILDATHILTAAHCTDAEGTKIEEPTDKFLVLTGDSYAEELSSTSQVREVASIRRDPLYKVSPISDDVAIMTLSTPLELSAEKDAEAIGLVAAGATPPPGTTLSISGYGKEQGSEAAEPTGELNSTTLTAISSEACLGLTGPESAVLLCAISANSSTCQGDSGGPLTEGAPAVEVGIVDFGLKECPVGQPDAFTNIAAPEIRAFIEGSESPPVAPRPVSAPVIKTVNPAMPTPVDYGPLTCEPGAWSGSPSYTYTFRTESVSPQPLQGGATNVFTPPSTLVGAQLVCVVQASNPGGVATYRSAATPAVAADTTLPTAKLAGLKCHLQTCVLSFSASDPNGVALITQPSVAYSVPTKCPKKEKKKRKGRSHKPVKQPVCHKTLTVPITPVTLSPGVFQATVSKLPYGETITFVLDVSNAAGLKVAPVSTLITLHKPKPKPKPKKKSKKKKKR